MKNKTKKNIWLIKISEPVAMNKEERFFRMRIFADVLSKNFNTTYFTSNFEHNTKSFLFKNRKQIRVNSNLKIIFTKAIKYNKNLSITRLVSHFLSTYRIYCEMQRLDKPDLIICAYPIPELVLATILYSKKNNTKFIVDYRDLWPETNFESIRKIKKYFLFPIFYMYKFMSTYIFNNTEYIISLTKEFNSHAEKLKGKKFSDSKVIPLMYKKTNIPDKKLKNLKQKMLKKYNLNQRDWIALFVGSVNQYFDFDPILKSAKSIHIKKKNIKFVIVGNGNELNKLKKRVIDEKINNIIFTGWLDKYELISFLSISKIGLAPYKNLVGFEKNITNKIFEYIAYGLPILTSSVGKMKKFISSNNIGYYYSNINHQRLTNKILFLSENKSEYKILKKTCINLYIENYQSIVGEYKLLKFVEKILNR